MKLLALGITSFGVWCLADEMGAKKPLNRAGLVFFAFAAIARMIALVDRTNPGQAGFLLLYTFALLLAVLLLSIAFLHRGGNVRRAGALGALGTLAPLLVLVAGHFFVGLGTAVGVSALYGLSASVKPEDAAILPVIDILLLIWGLVAALFLWRGDIASEAPAALTGAARITEPSANPAQA